MKLGGARDGLTNCWQYYKRGQCPPPPQMKPRSVRFSTKPSWKLIVAGVHNIIIISCNYNLSSQEAICLKLIEGWLWKLKLGDVVMFQPLLRPLIAKWCWSTHCMPLRNQQHSLCTWQVPIRLAMHVGEWYRVIIVWATSYFSDVVIDINRIFLPYHVIQWSDLFPLIINIGRVPQLCRASCTTYGDPWSTKNEFICRQ